MVKVCSPKCFDLLRKEIMQCARPYLPKGTRVKFTKFKYDAKVNESGFAERKSDNSYLIGIASGMSEWYTTTMIMHEIAHVMHMSNGDEGKMHGATYWKWHGKLYCDYIGED